MHAAALIGAGLEDKVRRALSAKPDVAHRFFDSPVDPQSEIPVELPTESAAGRPAEIASGDAANGSLQRYDPTKYDVKSASGAADCATKGGAPGRQTSVPFSRFSTRS
jgi:hypothetical protein